nr:hypothetical protein [Massilia sp. PDC64]
MFGNTCGSITCEPCTCEGNDPAPDTSHRQPPSETGTSDGTGNVGSSANTHLRDLRQAVMNDDAFQITKLLSSGRITERDAHFNFTTALGQSKLNAVKAFLDSGIRATNADFNSVAAGCLPKRTEITKMLLTYQPELNSDAKQVIGVVESTLSFGMRCKYYSVVEMIKHLDALSRSGQLSSVSPFAMLNRYADYNRSDAQAIFSYLASRGVQLNILNSNDESFPKRAAYYAETYDTSEVLEAWFDVLTGENSTKDNTWIRIGGERGLDGFDARDITFFKRVALSTCKVMTPQEEAQYPFKLKVRKIFEQRPYGVSLMQNIESERIFVHVPFPGENVRCL